MPGARRPGGQTLEGWRAKYPRGLAPEENRRGRYAAGALTVAAHLTLAALVFGIYAGPRAIQDSPLTFVMLKDEVPKLEKPPLSPTLHKVKKIIVPEPMFDMARDEGNGGLKMVGGPVSRALSDPSYLAQIQAHLARYNTYPPAAAAKHLTGTVFVQFIWDTQGNILFARVGKSSGSPVLDDSAMAVLQKAQPLPPIPPNLDAERMYVLLPIAIRP
jgi:TonB family protein